MSANNTDETKEEHRKLFYELVAKNHGFWADLARDFISVAEKSFKGYENYLQDPETHIGEDYPHRRMYLFLYGLAIENLIKGLLVKRNPVLVENGVISKSKLKTHNLVALFKMAEDIKLSKSDVELLNVLADSVQWSGRYAIPLEHKDFKEVPRYKFTEYKLQLKNLIKSIGVAYKV